MSFDTENEDYGIIIDLRDDKLKEQLNEQKKKHFKDWRING